MPNLNFKAFLFSIYLGFGLFLNSQSQNLQGLIYIIETDSSSHSNVQRAHKIGTIHQVNDTTFQIITFDRAKSKSDTVTKFVTQLFDYERVFKNERLFCYSANAKLNYFTLESQLNVDHISAYLNNAGIKKTKAKTSEPVKSTLISILGYVIEGAFQSFASTH